jgi:hypothetical protein
MKYPYILATIPTLFFKPKRHLLLPAFHLKHPFYLSRYQMCKTGIMLRASNRGAGCREIVPNVTYEVNVPAALRGKQYDVEVVAGSIELGVQVNVASYQGYDCETDFGTDQFQAGRYNTLFTIAPLYVKNNDNLGHPMAEKPYRFRVGSLPERLTFSMFGVYEQQNIDAVDMVAGTFYKITTVGTTDFTLHGASANEVGVVFQFTGGTVTGTGVVTSVSTKQLVQNEGYISFTLKLYEIDED